MAQVQYIGTGRRKNAVARVRLVPGTGKITVNKKDVEEYIPHADLREVINQPFGVTELTRDARMVERKKPGLKKARKASQFSKR